MINYIVGSDVFIHQGGIKVLMSPRYYLIKGCLKFRQYIKTKRAWFGIKLYELTTSDGITLDLMVCGKGMFINDDPNSEMPSTEIIPSVLMAPYLGKGHILYNILYKSNISIIIYLLIKRMCVVPRKIGNISKKIWLTRY